MTTIRVTESREVKLTPENEMDILGAEWDRLYGVNEFWPGDIVRFIDDSDPGARARMGGAFEGKLGKVAQMGDNCSAKVLTITNYGEFFHLWTKERNLELVKEAE